MIMIVEERGPGLPNVSITASAPCPVRPRLARERLALPRVGNVATPISLVTDGSLCLQASLVQTSQSGARSPTT